MENMEETVKISERVAHIIEEHCAEGNFVHRTLSFVRAVLAPESMEGVKVTGKEIQHYDMQYRYDHTLRVADIGKEIARAEGISEEALVMACLLHDVGYPECKSFEELGKHPAYGAEIARRFLEKIGYDRELSKSICKAILIHDRFPYKGEDATVFEKSVRDADDIDRADAMRICIRAYHDIGECPAWETEEVCTKRLEEIKGLRERLCGTKTAKCLWLENLDLMEKFYQKLLLQMERTKEL